MKPHRGLTSSEFEAWRRLASFVLVRRLADFLYLKILYMPDGRRSSLLWACHAQFVCKCWGETAEKSFRKMQMAAWPRPIDHFDRRGSSAKKILRPDEPHENVRPSGAHFEVTEPRAKCRQRAGSSKVQRSVRNAPVARREMQSGTESNCESIRADAASAEDDRRSDEPKKKKKVCSIRPNQAKICRANCV